MSRIIEAIAALTARPVWKVVEVFHNPLLDIDHPSYHGGGGHHDSHGHH